MKSQIASLLNFLSLLDREGRLSITNIAMYIVLVKLAMTAHVGLPELGALLLALLNYAHKRYVSQESADEALKEAVPAVAVDAKKIEDLVSKVNALSIKVGLSK